ncbi:MAG: ABC transporter permease [Nitrospiraceae bacterium]|nr:ABC transporter permease [Nitrospiraceae bacterium]
MRGFSGIFTREVMIIRKRFFKMLISFSVTPLLYLIAFGWGLGHKMTVEGIPYISFLLPGLIAMSSMSRSFAISSEINIARFYWHIFEEFQAAPVSNLAIASGEVLGGILRGFFASFIIIILAFLFHVKIHLNAFLFLAILGNTFTFSSLAIITSMLVRSHADQSMLNNFIITPMAFLCGTVFSLKALPGWAEGLIQLLPLSPATKAIRASALGHPMPWIATGSVFAGGIVFFILGVVAIRGARE